MDPLHGVAGLADTVHQPVRSMLRARKNEYVAFVLAEERQKQRPLLVRLDEVYVLNRAAGRHGLGADGDADGVLRLLLCERSNRLCQGCREQ